MMPSQSRGSLRKQLTKHTVQLMLYLRIPSSIKSASRIKQRESIIRTWYVIDAAVGTFQHRAEVGRAPAGGGGDRGGGGDGAPGQAGVGRVAAGRQFAVVLKSMRHITLYYKCLRLIRFVS